MLGDDINHSLESIDDIEFNINGQSTQVNEQNIQTNAQCAEKYEQNNTQIRIAPIEELQIDEDAIMAFNKLIPTDKTLITDKNQRYTIYSHLLSLYCYMESKLNKIDFYFTKKPLINDNPDKIITVDEIVIFRKKVEYSFKKYEQLQFIQLYFTMSLLHTFLSNKHKKLTSSNSKCKISCRLIKNIPNCASDLFEANTTSLTGQQIFWVASIIFSFSFILQLLVNLGFYGKWGLLSILVHYLKITLI